VEGGVYLPLFKKQLEMWKADGVSFLTLDELAKETLVKKNAVAFRELARISLPNRAGLVSSISR
jgi:hypothetical protein